MFTTLSPTLKSRLAREILARCQSIQFGVMPWLYLNFEDLDSVRDAHHLSMDQLADVLLDVAYIWRDGAALSQKRLSELLEKVAATKLIERRRRPAA